MAVHLLDGLSAEISPPFFFLKKKKQSFFDNSVAIDYPIALEPEGEFSLNE